MNTSKVNEILKLFNSVPLALDALSNATSGNAKAGKAADYLQKVRTSRFQKKPRYGERNLIKKC